MSAPRINFISDSLAMLSGASALASWQEQLDWSLRVLASVIAIAAGSYALYQRLKSKRRERD